MVRLNIDPEYKNLIPALSADEFRQLEENILQDGCRDPLVVWDGTILDGHNRYRICTENGLDFETVEANVKTKDEALKWMIDNQLGRRNITNEQRTYLLGLRYRQEKKCVGAPEGNTNPSKQLAHNEPFVPTAEAIAKQHNVGRETVKRAEKYADALDRIESIAPEIKQEILQGKTEVTKKEVIELAAAPIEKLEAKVEEIRKPHVSNNSGNNEWYTPPEFIEVARRAMGSIDTDPASSEVANEFVKAETYYTADDDGLTKEWHGNVWMNPPYSQPHMTQFAEKLIQEIEAGNAKQAMVLVNNATETGWFNTLSEKAKAIWFIRGRIRYLDRYGNVANSPLQGQCILYYGDNVENFIAQCEGLVCRAQYER